MRTFAVDMRTFRYIYIIGIVAVALVGLTACGGKGSRMRSDIPDEKIRTRGDTAERRVGASAGITLFTEERAMSFMAHEPERALQIIDSAEAAGCLKDFRADMLRARVYCRTYEQTRTDSAIVIGERLMLHDSVKADYDIRQDVLEILQDAYRMEKDYERALYWSVQLSDLFREHGIESGLLRNDVEIGALQVRLGQQDEGLARIDSVAATLKGTREVWALDISIIALKRKAEVCCETGLYAEAIPVAQQMLGLLDDFERHADDFTASSTLPAEQYPGYIDFYRSKAYAYLAGAYASQSEKGKVNSEKFASAQKAREYLSLYNETDAGQTLHGRFLIAPTMGRLGQYDRMLAIYDEAEQQLGSDTLNANYAGILRGRAEAADAQGRYAAASDYWQRYAGLQKQLHDTLLAGKAHLFAARYHAQEQQRQIAEQRAGKRLFTAISIATGILALLILAFALYAFRQWRATREKNRILAQQITEAVKYKEKYRELSVSAEPSVHSAKPELAISDFTELSDEQLFLCLRDLIENEQLFLQPDFGRQSLIDRTGLSKERIGAAFAQGSDSVSLPAYVRELRLDYAVRLMNDQPYLSVEQVCQASGFTSADTFTRNFRAKYGMTPTAYKQTKG